MDTGTFMNVRTIGANVDAFVDIAPTEAGMFAIVILVVSVVGALLIMGLFILIFWKVFSGFARAQKQTAQVLATGQPAQGRILMVRDLGASIRVGGKLPQQKFQIDLEVTPHGGQPPYRASITQMVSMMHLPRLQPGATVEVRYDPMNPMRVALVL